MGLLSSQSFSDPSIPLLSVAHVEVLAAKAVEVVGAHNRLFQLAGQLELILLDEVS